MAHVRFQSTSVSYTGSQHLKHFLNMKEIVKDIPVICLIIVLKLTITGFISIYFWTLWLIDF